MGRNLRWRFRISGMHATDTIGFENIGMGPANHSACGRGAFIDGQRNSGRILEMPDLYKNTLLILPIPIAESFQTTTPIAVHFSEKPRETRGV